MNDAEFEKSGGGFATPAAPQKGQLAEPILGRMSSEDYAHAHQQRELSDLNSKASSRLSMIRSRCTTMRTRSRRVTTRRLQRKLSLGSTKTGLSTKQVRPGAG